MTRIAVVIPVGPEEHHADYLKEALQSVADQTREADYVLLVDDMHKIEGWIETLTDVRGYLDIDAYKPPWRLGVGSAFNHGVAIALNEGNDLALMLGADDKLEPRVLERLERTYERHGRAEGYYWHSTVYSTGEEQGLPSNNAAVTAGFMRETGGLPIEASSGGMDAALISAMLVHRPEYLIRVEGNEGRFWGRVHPNQESARLGAYFGAIDLIRNVYTETWQPTRWGRFS